MEVIKMESMKMQKNYEKEVLFELEEISDLKNMQEGEILLGITLGFGTVQTLICC